MSLAALVLGTVGGKVSERDRKRETNTLNEFKAIKSLFACEPGVYYAPAQPIVVPLADLHDGVRDCQMACARTHHCRVLSHAPANGTDGGARCVLSRSREGVAAAADAAVACVVKREAPRPHLFWNCPARERRHV